MYNKQLLPFNAFQCLNTLCTPAMGEFLLTLYPCSTYPYNDFLTHLFPFLPSALFITSLTHIAK